MTKLEAIEAEITKLSPDELARLREWFEAYDAEQWDRQFEADTRAGRLDELADRALRDDADGRTRPL